MKIKLTALICFALLNGCLPVPTPLTATAVPSFTPLPPATFTPIPPITTDPFIATESPTPLPIGFTPGATSTPVNSAYCTDTQVTAVIDSLKTSMLTENGTLLSSRVNPNTGMDVRFFRTGNVLTYSQLQAKYLFITTYQADWGAHPASGENVIGAFHEVVVPELVKVFKQPYVLYCNELKHGGATYQPGWDYDGNFYVVYFPGTKEFGNLDWHSWVIGIDYVNGKPYIYAMTQFFWEP